MDNAVVHFLLLLPRRLHRIWKLSFSPGDAQTYYPNAARKGRWRIFWDNLWWLFRYQEVNANYYLYGFDRSEMTGFGEYLSAADSRKMRNCVRSEWARNNGGFAHEAVANDKFIFGMFCAGAGLPSPRIRALWDGREILWMDERGNKPLESLLTQAGDGVLKDCTGGQGKGVHLFRVDAGQLILDGRPTDMNTLRAGIEGRWLIQDLVTQHPRMNELYPRSINTVRVVTVMQDREPRLFCANGRFGVGGQNKDNWSIGGITIAVDTDKGCFRGRGLYKPGYGTWATRHPDTRMELDGFALPFWPETCELVLRAHKLFYGFHSLGWDVAFTAAGPVLLEVNHDWLLTFMQAVHGGLRKRFYDTIPAHLRNHTRGCDIHGR
jgi:hypothetical protein